MAPFPTGSACRAVIFDLDGTLADAAGDIGAALNVALAGEGLAPFDVPEVKRMVGGGARKLIARALAARGRSRVGACPGATNETDEALAAGLLETYLAAYRAAPCVTTTLFPGAREAVLAQRAAGRKVGLCTNKPIDITRPLLAALGITADFDSIVGGGEGRPPKPAPDLLALSLQQLGVAPSEAVLVGDSGADVGAARALGVAVVLVPHGYGATPAVELGADRVLRDFEELAPLVG
jgi:phosphoglycolate phosphatase